MSGETPTIDRCLRPVRGCATDEQYRECWERIEQRDAATRRDALEEAAKIVAGYHAEDIAWVIRRAAQQPSPEAVMCKCGGSLTFKAFYAGDKGEPIYQCDRCGKNQIVRAAQQPCPARREE